MAALGILGASAGPALAKLPGSGIGQPHDDTDVGPRTAAQSAFEVAKLGLVAQVEALSTPRSGAMISAIGTAHVAACETSCDYGTGDGGGTGGATDTGAGSGSTGGTTGFTTPGDHMVLAVRARHQSTVFWCGPASGQVVINYSRGYVYDSLNGDSSATNWKTQATIAGWMKTTESQGTLGSNLAAALNRPDAVQKPIPEWTYLYGHNADAEDLHSKIVTDVSQFAMPAVIAVMPHKTGAAYWLPSWPRDAGNAKHWIVIYGYDGLWDGTQGPQLYYTESAGNGSKNPGQYIVDSYAMWKVNQYNASTMVW
ncbi:MAG: hypothetical protein ABI725_07120 [Chloroflexota bacterium]